jgi:TldD protein
MSGPSTSGLDPTFPALPYRVLGDAALQRARELGASHADFRFERVRYQQLGVRDGALQGASDTEDLGFAVRVVHRGAWGFAAGVMLTPDEAVRVAESAVAVARVAAAMTTRPVELAPEPVHDDVTWVSAYDVNPFEVPTAEKADLLVDWTNRLREGAAVEHASAYLLQVQENKYYADLAGTRTTQQRIRLQPGFEAMGTGADTFDSMSSIAPPVGRGWEYLTTPAAEGGWDWDEELAEVPELLAEKLRAPSVRAGTYDLVLHPSNLWLTIHESVGHATELDRALGYEASYAGTSFATYDRLGTLRYGSPVMNVTGDRTVEHGLATVGYDDEGVQTQGWDIVRDGVLVGYQLDRSMAAMKPELSPGSAGGRSNGCADADSPGHIPIQRRANVSLQPDPAGPDTDGLISRVERGIYVVGDKSWSIDMQRFNFQFTGQRFYRIENGRLAGQVRDVAYQATTTEFWNSMEAVGGPDTWVLGGAFNCGKAQPGQVAAVSHGCPTSLFRDVNILNTNDEAGR